MKNCLCSLITLMAFAIGLPQSLAVSENHRYLVETSNIMPFVWIGDTAWELFHKLDRDEASLYLETRAKQGFTVIQAVILAEMDGLKVPNAYGEVPLVDLSPNKPNEKYFEHVDFIVNKANALGLQMALLPTWGDKVNSVNPGAGPIVFNMENAYGYGRFLGKRYKDKDVVWVLGGDRNIMDLEVLQLWRNMAKGLEEGNNGKHLIGYHPRGDSSSAYFLHNEDWLDFNMYQTGHARRYNKVYEVAEAHYLLQPVKPFIEAEPAYEGIPIKFWEYTDWVGSEKVRNNILDQNNLLVDPSYYKEGFFTDYDVRVHAYWNFLTGTCGYTYGNNAIWQMFDKGGNVAIPCLKIWKDAMYDAGAQQLIHLRKLLELRDFSTWIPDQSAIYGLNPKNENHIRSATAMNGSSVILYLALGQEVHVVMDKIRGSEVRAQWFDPRTGKAIFIGEFTNEGIRTFTPPSSGVNNDWILVLDSKEANLSPF